MESNDIAKSGWASVTVAVAWTLATQSIRVERAVLSDLRDHVLFNLDPNTPLARAEDLAAHLAREFVAVVRREPTPLPWSQDAAMALSPRWHKALESSLNQLSRTVFRQHYANGRSLAELERALQVDTLGLEVARSGLREVVRDAAIKDEVPLDHWPAERMDALLSRLAAYSPGPCPPLAEVIDGLHPDHTAECPRCHRANRLIGEKHLEIAELIPPAAPRPSGSVQVMALHFHPEGRKHVGALAQEFQPTSSHIQDNDLLLVGWDDADAGRRALRLAAEVESPRREHLRGALLTGPGRWSKWGLLGPLAQRARDEVRTRTWGTVDGLGELPAVLPPPPNPRTWWAAAGLAVLVGVGLLGLAFLREPDVGDPLRASFTPARGGLWVAFDTVETDAVALITYEEGRLRLTMSGEKATDKASIATGDGSYRVHVRATRALVVSAPAPLADLPILVNAAQSSELPIVELAERIQSRYPEAQLAYY